MGGAGRLFTKLNVEVWSRLLRDDLMLLSTLLLCSLMIKDEGRLTDEQSRPVSSRAARFH